MSILSNIDDIRELRPRLKLTFYIVSIAFIILLGRLWYLQVLRGEHFFDFSRSNTIKKVPIQATRGRIFDQKMRVLANSRPAYKVLLNRQYVDNIKLVTRVLSELLNIPLEEVNERLKKARGQPRFWPVLIKDHLRHEQVARIEVNRVFFPGIETVAVPARYYPYGEATFHLLGFLGEVNQNELKDFQEDNPGRYNRGDFIGKSGLEKAQDLFLKGIDGGEQVAVDALGRRTDDALFIRDLNDLPSIPGHDLVLTIDIDLQAKAKALFDQKGHAGSAIIMDVNTGAIRTLYSSPSLNPHMFVRVVKPSEWRAIQTNIRKPLIDKSLTGQFAPGSTYKMVTAAAALDLKVISPNKKIFCPGHYRLGRRRYRCWKAAGHGNVNMREAMQKSCDVYFYRVGQMVTIDRLAAYANRFGFGELTNIGFNNEKPGLIPTEAWKLKYRSEPWIEGETLSAAIGQGYNLVTPIQLVRALAAFVNGGKLYKPWVIEKRILPDGEVIETVPDDAQIGTLGLRPEDVQVVINGMVDVVQKEGGTAYWTRLKEVPFGGKTGTSQVVRIADNKRRLKTEEMRYKHRDHAWFMAFAPIEKPEIAVVILAEHGGHGSTAAAPIARDLIRLYFENKNKDIEKDEVPQTEPQSDPEDKKFVRKEA